MSTIGERYDPAMAITDQDEADRYFETLVTMAMSKGLERDAAEVQERHNLAYYAGYFNAETRARVERLFACQHPAFGAVRLAGSRRD